MPKKVKRTRDRTRISAKHQVTIPAAAFRAAGLEPGDTLRAAADGSGRVVLTRVEDLVGRYAGCIDTGGELRRRADELRGEWR